MIIIVINQKGGVGKTTVSVNLSYGLAKRGADTLLLDLDPQAHSTVVYCPEAPEGQTVSNIFIDKNCDFKPLIRPASVHGGEIPNLSIVPANIHLAKVPEQIISRNHREKILHNQMKKITDDFNFVVIDCPPTLGVLTANAVYCADFILIPTTYGKYSLDGIADLFESIDDIAEGRKYVYRILRNMFDVRNKQSNQFTDDQLSPFRDHVLTTIIRRNEAINQSQMNSETIFTFDPKSHGAEDFGNLAKEVSDYAKEDSGKE
ncbi:MAG: ParA family protein [Candidatus Magnetominusculus sp. LBB02]|nr:ParA family protein [Candidatus Magnetominusculus sp. LBB02]